jgi:hypothetical protein
MKKAAQAAVIFLILGFIILFSNNATCQNIRDFTCDIFKCTAFTDLVAAVQAIHQDVLALGTPADYGARFDAIEAEIADLKRPEASRWLTNVTGQQNDQVTVDVMIRGESLTKIVAWGLHCQYPAAMIRLDAVEAGELMPDWQAIDFNESTAGVAIVGAYAGQGRPIVGTAIGCLFRLKFTILGTAGNQAAACLLNYVDDLAGYHPDGACSIVTIE